EVHSDVGFVRSLVCRKANVAIDPHERSAIRLGIDFDPRANSAQTELEVGDEVQAGLFCEGLVTFFILQKPLALVVAFELNEKLKHFGREIGFGHNVFNFEIETELSIVLGVLWKECAPPQPVRPLPRCSPGLSTPCWA